MESKDIKDFAIIAVVGYGLSVLMDLFGKPDKDVVTPPKGYVVPAGATITYTEANDIAEEIKASMGYFSCDIVRVDKAMWSLQNKFDVEVLYQAFGKDWDGPGLINGDLFVVLNIARHEACWTCSQANYTSIKKHVYEYSKNLKNY